MSQPSLSASQKEQAFHAAMEAGHTAAWNLEWEKAAQAYARAVALKPRDYWALVNLGLALFSLGQWREAAEVYRKAAEVAPREPAPWEKLAQIFERLGNEKAAVEAAMAAAERYARSEQWEKAIAMWEQAARLAPSYLEPHYYAALAYQKLGRKYEAAPHFLYAIALLQRVGRQSEAIRVAQRALQFLPQHPEIRRALQLLARNKPVPIPKWTPPEAAQPTTGPLAPKHALAALPAGEGDVAPAPTATEDETDTPRPLDEEAFQAALSVMAELLFMQAEESDDETRETPKDRLRRLTQAREAYRNLAAAQRDKVVLLLTKAFELQSQGKWRQAAAELERAQKAGLQHAALAYALGVFYLRAGEPKRAFAALQKALTHPDFALAARWLRAKILADQNRYKAAAQEALEALYWADWLTTASEQRQILDSYYEVLRTDLERKKLSAEQAEKIYRSVAQLLEAPDWRERIAALRTHSDETHSHEMLSTSAESAVVPLAEFILQVQNPELLERMRRIRAYMQRHLYDAAMEEAHFALFDAPTFLPLHILIGDILWYQSLLEQAAHKFLVLAKAYQVRGEGLKAVQMLRRVLEINPLHTQAHNMLIALLMEQGAHGEVAEAYRKLGEVHYELANLDEAAQALEKAAEWGQRAGWPPEQQAQVLKIQAAIAEQRFDWDRARAIYQKWTELTPDDTAAWEGLLDLELRLENDERMVRALDRMFRHFRARPGGLKSAIQVLERLVQRYPKHLDLRLYLARMYAFDGQQQEALEAYDRLIETYMEMGNTLAAKRALKSALALNPPPTKAQVYRSLLQQIEAA